MFRLIMTAGMVATLCLLAGCGSSGSGATSASETTSKPLTRAELIRKADAVCSQFAKERDAATQALEEKAASGSTQGIAQAEEGIKEVIVPLLEKEATELGELTPPEKEATQFNGVIKSLDHLAQVLSDEGVKGLTTPALSKYEDAAAHYGLKICPAP